MILHIANDYSGSTVYKNLVKEIDNLGAQQVVYTPVREKDRIGKNNITFTSQDSKIIYSQILNKTIDRLLYRRKVSKIVRDIELKINMSTIKIIHAHTWYSDGGAAYLLAKKYNIPFIVTIRTTDLNVFQKYLIHEWGFGRRILESAKNVILISASYQNRILRLRSLDRIKASLLSKIEIIPNGVDSYWINNATNQKTETDRRFFKLLYVGRFLKGKNVFPLLSAINEINRDFPIVHLDLIGGGGWLHKKIIHQVELNPDTMKYHGKINELPTLREYYRNADFFVMPSKYETFGLVYVEAMLQGLPILYTENEGIDGLYGERIGEKVSSGDVEEIKRKILTLLANGNSYVLPTDKLITTHNWKTIALRYLTIYESIYK